MTRAALAFLISASLLAGLARAQTAGPPSASIVGDTAAERAERPHAPKTVLGRSRGLRCRCSGPATRAQALPRA